MSEQMNQVMEYIQQKDAREDVRWRRWVLCYFVCNMLHLNQAFHFCCACVDE
jgi:hypothetical protein